MDPDSRSSLILVILLFIASAYFALTETAIASVSRNRIKVASERGDARAKKVMYVLDHFEDAITTLLILTNIAHIAAASLTTVMVTRRWGLSAVTLSTAVVTLLMFFLSEMLPKSIGKKIPEKASLASSGFLVVLMKICTPLTFILTSLSSFVMKRTKGEEASVTEDELYDIIEDMAEEGDISDEQSELISQTLQFSDVTAASILTPRVDVAAVDVNKSPEEVLDYIRSQNHSRILVYEETIDRVVGVLQIRKFLRAYIAEQEIPDLRSLMDEVYFTHQSIQIDELLMNMSEKKLNMAVVTDAYGGTMGVVTVEDILEELVGEIWDEDDEIREPIVQLTDNSCLADADETVQDVFDFMEFEDPEEENEDRFTNLLMADWIMENLGHIPEEKEAFDYHNLHISVEEMDHNRICKILIEMTPEGTNPGEETPEGMNPGEETPDGTAVDAAAPDEMAFDGTIQDEMTPDGTAEEEAGS